LTQKLLKQGYFTPRVKSSLQTFYGGHHNLVDRYEISRSQTTMDLFDILRRSFVSSISAKTFTRLYMRSNSVGILYEAGTAYHSREP